MLSRAGTTSECRLGYSSSELSSSELEEDKGRRAGMVSESESEERLATQAGRHSRDVWDGAGAGPSTASPVSVSGEGNGDWRRGSARWTAQMLSQ